MTVTDPAPDSAPRALKITTSFQSSPAMKRRLEEAAAREGVSQQRVVQRALVSYFDRLDKRAWGTIDDDDFGYDPNRYYTFGADSKGHSSEIRLLVPKPLRGEIQRLIESGAIPEYHTAQHVARDALYHRVKQLSRMLENGELEVAVDLSMLISEEEHIRAQEVEARKLVEMLGDNLRSLMSQAIESGDFTRVTEYLADRASKTNLVPEQYRADYEGILREYKRLIRRSRRGKAIEIENGEE